MNFKKTVYQAAGYAHKAAEWYGTAKPIDHAGKVLAGFAAKVAPFILGY